MLGEGNPFDALTGSKITVKSVLQHFNGPTLSGSFSIKQGFEMLFEDLPLLDALQHVHPLTIPTQ